MGLDPSVWAALGPSAAAVVVTTLFLHHIRLQSKAQNSLEEQTRDALDRNTEVLGAVLELLRRLNGRKP